MNKGQEYELEEYADCSIEEIRNFIDTELQLVKEKHDLCTKLLALSNIIMHLDERLPENLHKFNGKITDGLIEIQELIESGKFPDLKIIKEEKEILKKIEKETEQRMWLAVKNNLNLESKKEKITVRLEKDELRELHKKFIDLMKLMKRSDLICAINEDLTKFKEKEKYLQQEEYYFLQIYKFLRVYERIFRHLWKKERRLQNKLN